VRLIVPANGLGCLGSNKRPTSCSLHQNSTQVTPHLELGTRSLEPIVCSRFDLCQGKIVESGFHWSLEERAMLLLFNSSHMINDEFATSNMVHYSLALESETFKHFLPFVTCIGEDSITKGDQYSF